MRCPLAVVFFAMCLAAVDARYVERDPRLLRKVIQDNTGIIEWIVEHIEEAIRELEKASTVRSYECLVGMAYIVQDLSKGRLWAVGMIDSSAKIPDGMLQANFNDLGVYDQCIAIENPNPEMPFSGMHCLVDFKITVPSNTTIENLPAAKSTPLRPMELSDSQVSPNSASFEVSGESSDALKEPEVDDFVLVRFFGKKKFVFYVGKVISKYLFSYRLRRRVSKKEKRLLFVSSKKRRFECVVW